MLVPLPLRNCTAVSKANLLLFAKSRGNQIIVNVSGGRLVILKSMVIFLVIRSAKQLAKISLVQKIKFLYTF